jgi:hypothetical protein
MRDESRNDLDRREFLKAGLTAAAVLPLASALLPGTARAEDEMVTEVEAMKPTVQALQYVSESTKPDQSCKLCQFYTPVENGKGKCQLFVQGLVSENGWCMSWTKKVT